MGCCRRDEEDEAVLPLVIQVGGDEIEGTVFINHDPRSQHAAAGVIDGKEGAGDVFLIFADQSTPDTGVIREEVAPIFLTSNSADLFFEIHQGRDVVQSGGADSFRWWRERFPGGQKHVLVDGERTETGAGVERIGVEIEGTGDQANRFGSRPLNDPIQKISSNALAREFWVGIHDAKGNMGLAWMVEAGSGEFPVDFRDKATARVQFLVNFRKDPANGGILAWKTAPIELLEVPLIGGVKDERGDFVPFVDTQFPNRHGSLLTDFHVLVQEF